MSGRSIVVTSGKGGVGKTTTVANLGVSLARSGYKVLLVDANIGLRNLDIMLNLEGRISYDLSHVLSGECDIESALVRDERIGQFYLLGAPDTRMGSIITPLQMRDLSRQLIYLFDYVVIDAPNGLDDGFQSAIAAAHEALIVTTPDVSSIRNVDSVIRALNKAGIEPLGLVLNRIRYNMMRRGEMLAIEDIPILLESPLLGVIPERQEVVVAANRGIPSALKSRSPSGKAFRNLADRIDRGLPPIKFGMHSKLSKFGALRGPENDGTSYAFSDTLDSVRNNKNGIRVPN
jgi:septum site-determining protein MinD